VKAWDNSAKLAFTQADLARLLSDYAFSVGTPAFALGYRIAQNSAEGLL
jgi:hypothetical protein